jgi:hypothetical protein
MDFLISDGGTFCEVLFDRPTLPYAVDSRLLLAHLTKLYAALCMSAVVVIIALMNPWNFILRPHTKHRRDILDS